MDNMPVFFDNARNGIRHVIPTTFSFRALRYFTMSPSFNYEEKWYGKRLTWEYNSDSTLLVKKDTTGGFYRISNYSVSASLATRIYGMYYFKKKTSKVKAIRHVINPTVGYSYTPDFQNNPNYFQRFEKYVNDTTTNVTYQDRYEGFVYSGSGRGNSSAINFGIGNNLEMKVQGPQDSVARKVMLLNNLLINGSYNFLAEKFKLSLLNLSANTNILDNLININLVATLDPYYYQPSVNEAGQVLETRIDELAWKNGSVGRITNATMSLSTNLNPKARNKNTTSREKIAKSDLPEQDKQFLIQNPDVYVDFDIPWSMNVQYNLNYSHPINADPRFVQTLTFAGDVSLSEKWKATYSSGFDIEAGAFTLTNIGITRDLHCWTMSLNWVPFGGYQQFYFTINVKSSLLQDLKLERRKPYFDNL
jgi:hypothetical protein